MQNFDFMKLADFVAPPAKITKNFRIIVFFNGRV